MLADNKFGQGIRIVSVTDILNARPIIYENINGMIESVGSELQIFKNCDFGTFKGSPTALEVFDAYYGYKG